MTTPKNSGPDVRLEEILSKWISKEFGIKTFVEDEDQDQPRVCWSYYILVNILEHGEIESGAWIRERHLQKLNAGDPKFFDKLSGLIKIRLKEIKDMYGDKPKGKRT